MLRYVAICVLTYPPARADDLRRFLEARSFVFETRPHAHFLARSGPGITLTAYESGKLLITGADAEEFSYTLESAGLAAPQATQSRTPGRKPVHEHLENFPRTGLDESGKGDYFGPLVAAAVHVADRASESTLVRLGVRDSKRVSDAEVMRLAHEIESRFPVARVIVAPPRYNELYAELGNLNLLLGWAHERALEEIASKTGSRPLGVVVLDQFEASGRFTARAQERFPSIQVVEVPRAEADPAVAAASIVARAAYLSRLDALGTRHGVTLAKGSGIPAERALRTIMDAQGRKVLPEVAKLHFRLTPPA